MVRSRNALRNARADEKCPCLVACCVAEGLAAASSGRFSLVPGLPDVIGPFCSASTGHGSKGRDDHLGPTPLKYLRA